VSDPVCRCPLDKYATSFLRLTDRQLPEHKLCPKSHRSIWS